jgi:hypothetical protein
VSAATPQTTGKNQQQDSFTSAMSQAMMRRLLVSLAATSAAAATAYLTRKAREFWDEQLAPKIEQRGGLEAVAKDTYATATDFLGSASTKVAEAAPVSVVAEKVEDLTDRDSDTEPEIQPAADISDPEREAERRERRRRREARQRALKSSGAK